MHVHQLHSCAGLAGKKGKGGGEKREKWKEQINQTPAKSLISFYSASITLLPSPLPTCPSHSKVVSATRR